MEGEYLKNGRKVRRVVRKRVPHKEATVSQEEDSTADTAMPKRNLEIQVIDHPEADQKAEEVAIGDGSDIVESEPQQESLQDEPNYREGTLGPHTEDDGEGEINYEEEFEEEEEEDEKQYEDSMDDQVNKQSMQSFGNNSGRKNNKRKEEAKVKPNAENSKVLAHHFNDFIKQSKDKDPMNQTQKLSKEDHGDEDPNLVSQAEGDDENGKDEYTEEIDDGLQDEELIRKQQQEAEALLAETKKTMNDADDVSEPSEDEEIEDDQKLAKENKYEDDLENEDEEDSGNDDEAIDTKDNKFSLNYTVGRIEDGAAILISKDHNLIEIPLCLLPGDIGPGNILKFSVERNNKAEKKRVKEILSIQKQILEDPNFFEE